MYKSVNCSLVDMRRRVQLEILERRSFKATIICSVKILLQKLKFHKFSPLANQIKKRENLNSWMSAQKEKGGGRREIDFKMEGDNY